LRLERSHGLQRIHHIHIPQFNRTVSRNLFRSPNNMKNLLILFALVAVASCAQIRKVVKAPYNQQPVRIEVEVEPSVAPAPAVSSRLDQSQVLTATLQVPAEETKTETRLVQQQGARRKVVSHKELEEEALQQAENEKIAQEQSRNAKYSFAAAVDDGIMDHSHVREESREGNKVTGSYSYSDGYVKRTVKYVADENGYRVVSEESEDIGDGPNVDMKGKADVHSQYDGVETKYSMSADDMASPEPVSTVEPEQELNGKSSRSRSKSQYSQ